MMAEGKTKYLEIRAEGCTGCRVCESTCSMVQEGVLNKGKSRIRIYRIEVLELLPTVCDQCKDRPCVAACPKGAIISRNRQVRVRRSACDGCGACITVCDKVFLSPDDGHAMICNQCGACVTACPEQVLSIGAR